MPRSTFDRRLSVTADPQATWAVLTDVAEFAAWVSVLAEAKEIEPLARYSAVLLDRVGPFKLRAELDIVVTDVAPGKRIHLRASGEDRQIGSRLVVEASMELDSAAETSGTSVRIDGYYEVTGKVAAMGAGTINKKAALILDEFFSHAGETLGSS